MQARGYPGQPGMGPQDAEDEERRRRQGQDANKLRALEQQIAARSGMDSGMGGPKGPGGAPGGMPPGGRPRTAWREMPRSEVRACWFAWAWYACGWASGWGCAANGGSARVVVRMWVVQASL